MLKCCFKWVSLLPKYHDTVHSNLPSYTYWSQIIHVHVVQQGKYNDKHNTSVFAAMHINKMKLKTLLCTTTFKGSECVNEQQGCVNLHKRVCVCVWVSMCLSGKWGFYCWSAHAQLPKVSWGLGKVNTHQLGLIYFTVPLQPGIKACMLSFSLTHTHSLHRYVHNIVTVVYSQRWLWW